MLHMIFLFLLINYFSLSGYFNFPLSIPPYFRPPFLISPPLFLTESFSPSLLSLHFSFQPSFPPSLDLLLYPPGLLLIHYCLLFLFILIPLNLPSSLTPLPFLLFLTNVLPLSLTSGWVRFTSYYHSLVTSCHNHKLKHSSKHF